MSIKIPDNADEELSPHLEYFGERLNLVFAYHFCIYEFRDDEDFQEEENNKDRGWSLKTIQNACLHSSLIALRDLQDFFTPRTSKNKKDDLKASDFGLESTLSILTKEERVSINKLIAHTTIEGVQQSKYGWDIDELVYKAVKQSNTFQQWIMDNYGMNHYLIYTAALAIQNQTSKILDWIQKQKMQNKSQ